MAAATVASSTTSVRGNRRRVSARLTAPADGDTFNTGLYDIDPGTIQITMIGATIAAADAVGVNSISGGTITFEVVGTARDILVTCEGI